MNGSRMRLGEKSKTSWKHMKINSQQSKTYGTQQSSLEREIHSNIGLPKKHRNISNKKPNPRPTSTGGTTTKTAQSKQKEGKNQFQSRVQ